MQPLSENAVNVPAFLSKLWKMVNDPSTDNLISWGPVCAYVICHQIDVLFTILVDTLSEPVITLINVFLGWKELHNRKSSSILVRIITSLLQTQQYEQFCKAIEHV